MATKPGSQSTKKKNKDKDKEHDKFSKLERGGGGKKSMKSQPRSLEKQVRNKKHNKPKAAPEPGDRGTVELPVGTVMINVPITVAGFAEQTKTTVSQIIMTLMKMGVMANINQNLDEDTVVLLRGGNGYTDRGRQTCKEEARGRGNRRFRGQGRRSQA